MSTSCYVSVENMKLNATCCSDNLKTKPDSTDMNKIELNYKLENSMPSIGRLLMSRVGQLPLNSLHSR